VRASSDAACVRMQVVQVSHGFIVTQRAIFFAMPPLTYHLVPRDEWEAADASQSYVPCGFGQDGFVHCTDGPDEVASTANRYFAGFHGDLLALVLDRAHLTAPVRYEDPGQIYPHVYGPIDRAAIIQVRVMARDDDSRYLAPA
jgi:uncharacterized protein (DUF952 family)